LKLDSSWIKQNRHAIDEATARFLLSVHLRGKLELDAEAATVLRERSGETPPAPKAPPPPFIVDPKPPPVPERTEYF
jgi:hypothetical protein